MGLFDRFRKRRETPAGGRAPERRYEEPDPHASFESACLQAFHEAVLPRGMAPEGLVFIPELTALGSWVVQSFLKDQFLSTSIERRPRDVHYAAMVMSLQAGLVIADKWQVDPDVFRTGYVDRLITEGPAWPSHGVLHWLGLTDYAQEDAFFREIFEVWWGLFEPHADGDDPAEYAYRADLAAFQLGLSVVLAKHGYRGRRI